jgi:hypothetical protein
MSPQPSPVRKFPLEDLGETGSLIFGEASPLSLTIPKALIAKIWGQVEEGVRIVPRGGVEVGGLLVGPKSRGSGVVVDGVIPLSIEYEHGPVFRMSSSDVARIAASVQSVQVDPSKAVVGFYRSQTRGSETFRDSDREIFYAIEQTHTSFATDFLCYLVLSPVSKTEMLTCVSVCNGEEWDGLQFTLHSSPLSVEATSSYAQPGSVPDGVQVSDPVEASLVPAVPQTVPPLTTEPGNALPDLKVLLRTVMSAVLTAVKTIRPPSKRFYVVAGVLVLAGAFGGYRWIVKRPEPAQTSVLSLHMGFSANREGPIWRLSWDRDAMAQIKPSGAVLAIKDGNRKQQLNLVPADLSSGTILYTPRGGDLVFSLQVERGSAAPIEEHIRVLDSQSVQKPPERGQQTLPNNTAVQAKASPRGSTAPTKLPPSATSATDGERRLTPIPGTNPARAETTAASASTRDVPPGPAETPQSPALDPRSATGLPPSSLTVPATQPSAVVPTTVKPAYIGPKPVQQVPPQRPPDVNSSGVRIQVHVEIDAQGNVTRATAIGVTAANSPLVSVTERAARSWQFEPARMDGRPVPSEIDILFRF